MNIIKIITLITFLSYVQTWAETSLEKGWNKFTKDVKKAFTPPQKKKKAPKPALKESIPNPVPKESTPAPTPPTPQPKLSDEEINKRISEIKERNADTETKNLSLLSADEDANAMQSDANLLKSLIDEGYKQAEPLYNDLNARVAEISRKRQDKNNQHWWDHKYIPEVWSNDGGYDPAYTKYTSNPGKGSKHVVAFAQAKNAAKKAFEEIKTHNTNAQDVKSLAADIDKLRELTPYLYDNAINLLKEKESAIKPLIPQALEIIKARNNAPQKQTAAESLKAIDTDKEEAHKFASYDQEDVQNALQFLDAKAKAIADKELDIIKNRNEKPQKPDDILANLKAINEDKANINKLHKYSPEKATETIRYLDTQGNEIVDKKIKEIEDRYKAAAAASEKIEDINKDINQLEDIQKTGFRHHEAQKVIDDLKKRIETVKQERIKHFE